LIATFLLNVIAMSTGVRNLYYDVLGVRDPEMFKETLL